MNGTSLTTGRLASAAGVGVETIRYYERRGLLRVPRRNRAGHREYDASDLKRLRFIRRAQELGFKLEEIRTLLDLRVEPRRSCRAVAAAADSVIERINATIVDLDRIRTSLEGLRSACDRDQPTSECPILDALETRS